MSRASKSEWTEYEKHFWDLCQEKGWKPEVDEDNTPVLRPGRSNDCYHLYAHGPGVFALCILATHARTKNTVISKMKKAKIITGDEDVFVEGDTEAIVLFKEDRLARAVKTLNLKRRKKGGYIPPREQLMKNLEKANAAKKDANA